MKNTEKQLFYLIKCQKEPTSVANHEDENYGGENDGKTVLGWVTGGWTVKNVM